MKIDVTAKVWHDQINVSNANGWIYNINILSCIESASQHINDVKVRKRTQ